MSNRAGLSWRQWLVNSQEWKQLLADYTEAMVRRALGASGRDDAAQIIEVSRDLRGVQAFRLWIENSISQAGKAGTDDGRPIETGRPTGAGDGTGDEGGPGGA
jgi:hypothetical protein